MKSEKSILIIDDDLGIRDGLSVLLQKYFITNTAASGAEALDTISTTHHDIYIIDLFLGDMSGFDILEKIKQTTPSAVTIMLTGFGSDEDILQAKKLGADEFLHKPISFPRLKSVIDKINSTQHQFEVSETTKASMIDTLKGMNLELFKQIRHIEKANKTLEGKVTPQQKEDINTIASSTANIRMTLEFSNTFIALKSGEFKDIKEEVNIKSVLSHSFSSLNDHETQVRAIVDDNKAYLHSSAFQVLTNVLVVILQKFPKSLLRIKKSTLGVELELINADLKIQQSMDSTEIPEGFPSIEISLLKELLKFMNARMNVKQEGLYTNLLINIPLL